MDKYENKIKIEEIKSLIQEGEFDKAADVADTVNWATIKNISTIGMASDLYKKLHRFEESREVLLYAYDRQKSRPIVKSLCELSIELGDLINGMEYYKEFVEIAPRDPAVFILKYKLYKLQNISLDEQIEVLEELKEVENIPKWDYELALLYHRAGMEDKCIEACDDLILWVVDGKYVIKAYELKAQHRPLTEQENYKYELLRQAGGELNIQYSLKEEAEETEKADKELEIGSDVSPCNTQNLQDVVKEGLQGMFATRPIETLQEEISDVPVEKEEPAPSMTREQAIALDEARKAASPTDVDQDLLVTQMYNPVMPEEPVGQELEMDDTEEEKKAEPERPRFSDTDIIGDVSNALAAEMLSERTEGMMAGSRIDSESVDVMQTSDEDTKSEKKTETASDDIQPVQYEYKPKVIGDTGVIETFHRGSNMDDFLTQETDGQIGMFVPTEPAVEKQITGQISMDEFMREWEKKKRESEARIEREIRAKVREQTKGLLKNFDDATKESLLFQIENAVIEAEEKARKEKTPQLMKIDDIPKLDETQRLATDIIAQALAEDNKEAKEEKIKQEEVKKEEPKGEEVKEEVKTAESKNAEPEGEAKAEDSEGTKVEAEVTEPEKEEPVKAEPKKAETKKTEPVKENPQDEKPEEELTETQAFRKEVDEIAQAFAEFEKNGLSEETEKQEKSTKERLAEEVSKVIPSKVSDNTEDGESDEAEDEKVSKPEERSGNGHARKLTKAESEQFSAFIHHKSTRRQLADTLDNVTLAAYTGNILVSAEEDAEITSFSKLLVQEIQMADSNFTGKVAMISGEKLNHKDIEVSLGMVNNGAMIITSPQDLKKKTVKSLLEILQKEGLGVVIIMQGKPGVLDQIVENNEGMAEAFNLRIDLKAFDDKTLVEYAKSYAYDNEYIIDEFGVLALHTRIDEMQTSDHEVTLAEIEEIVDEAIYYADKKTPRHFFDVLLGKRYGEEDMIVLRERDFMHY